MATTKPAAPKTDAPAADEPKKDVKPPEVNPSMVEEYDFRHTRWGATVNQGVKPEDILRPEFWSHVSAKLKPWDRVVCHPADGSWYCELLVTDSSRTWTRMVAVIGPISLTTTDVSKSQADKMKQKGYEVKWRQDRKWSVIRLSDSALLHEDEQTEAGAFAWLATFLEPQNVSQQ